jgi:hypothetical protein
LEVAIKNLAANFPLEIVMMVMNVHMIVVILPQDVRILELYAMTMILVPPILATNYLAVSPLLLPVMMAILVHVTIAIQVRDVFPLLGLVMMENHVLKTGVILILEIVCTHQ